MPPSPQRVSMPQTNRYEQQFLDALKAIFIGAKVEGESGYINLMKIKATYFEGGVFPRLMQPDYAP